MGDFNVGVSVGVYCTKCTLNTGVNTNFEITHFITEHIFLQNYPINRFSFLALFNPLLMTDILKISPPLWTNCFLLHLTSTDCPHTVEKLQRILGIPYMLRP
jgi:hypothetical protein